MRATGRVARLAEATGRLQRGCRSGAAGPERTSPRSTDLIRCGTRPSGLVISVSRQAPGEALTCTLHDPGVPDMEDALSGGGRSYARDR
jgi:hypothetical protein